MKSTKQTQSNSKKPLLIVALLVLVFAVVWAVATFLNKPPNYAKDVVTPLGAALQKEGAAFACDGGDAGRGVDNQTPYYRAYYKVKKSSADAATLIQKVATENGYNLTQGSPANRGPLDAVADTYIDKWYFDETSKKSPYEDLRQGNIVIMVVVDGPGSEDSCNSGKTTVDSEHTLIGVEAKLPSFK
jgi:hypothetical protein